MIQIYVQYSSQVSQQKHRPLCFKVDAESGSVGAFDLLFSVMASKQEKTRCDTMQKGQLHGVTQYLPVKIRGLNNKTCKK